MSEENAAPDTSQQQEGQQQEPDALAELGIQPDEQGRIPLADHTKLVNTVKTLREQVKSQEAAQRKAEQEIEKARLASLGEAERAIEEARKAGREEAMAEQRNVILGAQVVAHAAAAGFADPDDVRRLLSTDDLADEAAVKAAVAKLAKDKPYLLKSRVGGGGRVEQGPQGAKPSSEGTDWLGDRIRNKRAG